MGATASINQGKLALGVAVAAASLMGASGAMAMTKIDPARLKCDTTTRQPASKATPRALACIHRTPKKARKSAVPRDFAKFSSQTASDPRVQRAGRRPLRASGPAKRRPSVRTLKSVASSVLLTRQQITPILECVSRDDDHYVAHLGYTNPNAARVEVAVGPRNLFTVGDLHDQPTVFLPGRMVDVVQVEFRSTLTWSLDGQSVTATPNTKRCTTTPAPSLAPLRDQVAVVPMDDTAGGAEYQGLRTVGVPATVVGTVGEAVAYRIVLLAGPATPGRLSDVDVNALRAFVAAGGVLVGEAVTDERLLPLFGVAQPTVATNRSQITWTQGVDRTMAELDRASERQIDIDDRFGGQYTTVGYRTVGGGRVLATFDDGTAAVTRLRAGADDPDDDDDHADGTTSTLRSASDDEHEDDDDECDGEHNDHVRGAAYLLGARLTDLVTRHHQGARWSSKARYENAFDTSADGWLLWLRGIYRTHVDGGVTMSTAPAGKRFAVLPTLSLNFSLGVGPIADYVSSASARKVRPTVFVWTKTTTDYLDVAFFSDTGIFDTVMRAILAKGAEIQPQTVAHSPVFDKLPMGTGTETVADYRPFVASPTVTTGATVMGELRVSRQLIQSRLNPGTKAFRAGYMLTTPRLAVAEEAAGIRDDSSSTQGWVGGSLPFSIPRADGTGYAEVTTFPVAIEDERGARIDQRIGEARDLMAANGDNGAPVSILFHPNGVSWKLQAWDALLASIPSDAWSGTVQQFGDFWQDRSRAALATSPSSVCDGGRHVEVVSLNAAWPVRGQVLDVDDRELQKLRLATGEVRTVNDDGKVVLPDIAGGGRLSGELCH